MKLLRILLAASIIFAGPLVASSPALAHDEVISTMPGDAETVDAGKMTVTVAFSEDVLDAGDAKGLAIEVTAPDGSKVSNACVAVAGVEISTDIDVDQAGDYKVAWQSVSADGHPSTGEFGFTVKNDNKYKSEGVPSCDRLVIAPGPEAQSGSGDSASTSDSQTPVIIGLVVALAIVAFGGYYIRRRASKVEKED